MGGGRVAQATNADKATEATHSSTTDTLKTPVEINGTSFDGSKSITTDKWGTKRTIFLKNGASTFEASIDGSSDIELEIPQLSSSEDTPGTLAVASSSEVAQGTINNKAVTPAGLKQFIDRGQLGGVKDLGTGVDLDTLTTTGRYWCLGTGMINYPAANPIAAVVEVNRPGDTASNIHQTYIACTVNARHETTVFVYYRHTYTDSGVNKWAKWSRGNIASETEIGQLALATAEEVTAGTIGTKAVTPKTLKENYLPIDYGKDIDLKAALDTAMS